jgi:WD40 repeat protein
LSDDGELLAVGLADGSVQVWRLANLETIHRLPVDAENTEAMLFDRDGKRLITGGSSGLIQVWDLLQGRLIHALRGHSDSIASMALSHDGRMLASAALDGTVRLWELDRPVATDAVYQSPQRAVWFATLAFSADSNELLAGTNRDQYAEDFKGHVHRWAWRSGRPPTVELAAGAFLHVADATWSVGGVYSDTLKLAKDGRMIATLTGHEQKVGVPGFSRDARMMASPGYTDNTIRVWETQSGKLLEVLFDESLPTSVAFSPDGTTLAVGCFHRVARWRINDWSRLPPLPIPGELVARLAYSSDGSLLAFSTWSGYLTVWDTSTGQRLSRTRLRSRAFAFSPDGRRLAAVRQFSGEIQLLDPRTGQQLANYRDHDADIQSIAFSPDGRALASADGAGVIRVRVAEELPRQERFGRRK